MSQKKKKTDLVILVQFRWKVFILIFFCSSAHVEYLSNGLLPKHIQVNLRRGCQENPMQLLSHMWGRLAKGEFCFLKNHILTWIFFL